MAEEEIELGKRHEYMSEEVASNIRSWRKKQLEIRNEYTSLAITHGHTLSATRNEYMLLETRRTESEPEQIYVDNDWKHRYIVRKEEETLYRKH